MFVGNLLRLAPVFVLLAAVPLATSEGDDTSAPFRLEAQARGTSSCMPDEGSVVFFASLDSPLRGSEIGRQPLALDDSSAMLWELVPPLGAAYVSLELPRCWSDVVLLNAPAVGPVSLWPLAYVEGTVTQSREGKKEEKATPKVRVLVDVLGKDGQRNVPPLERPCTTGQATWSCKVPATKANVRIAIGDAAPLLLRGLEAREGDRIDLGKAPVVQGSSIEGWLTSQVPGVPVESVLLSLHPGGLEPTALRTLSAVDRYTTVADEQGKFRFENLPEGDWTLDIPAAPSYSGVEIRELSTEVGQTLELQDVIVLRKKAWLEVMATPAVAPDGNPWVVTVGKALEGSNTYQIVERGELSSDGYWLSASFDRGLHVVRLSDQSGNQYAEESVELGDQAAVVEMDLGLRRLAGRLTIGGEPLPGTVRLFDSAGSVLEVRTRNDGSFSTLVPPSESWSAKVELAEARGSIYLSELVASEIRDDRSLWLEIRLPNTRVEGRVTSDQGMVPGALVTIRSEDGATLVQGSSGEDGHFEFLGIKPQEIVVNAEFGPRTSRDHELDLETSPYSAGLEIFLTRDVPVRGQLNSPSGPVPGATILYRAVGASRFGRTVSSPAGEFEFRIPGSSSGVDLLVKAARFPLLIDRFLRTDEEDGTFEIDVDLQATGGTLSISLIPPEGHRFGERPVTLSKTIFRGPAGFHMAEVFPDGNPWSALNPATASLDLSVAPGEYSLCVRPRLDEECSTGSISLNGFLSLPYFEEAENKDRDRP